MLTLEQCNYLVDQVCIGDGTQESCEECPIYNTFNRGGSCAMRLYQDQQNPKVKSLLDDLIQNLFE